MAPNTIRARFWKGVRGTDPALATPLPQIAFVGRSNVGKSSVINSLLGVSVARSSNKPGKTTELNLYMVEDRILFVDIPGYGFAKLSGKEQEKIRKMILWYLFESSISHRLIVHLIDARIKPTKVDEELAELFKKEGKRVVVVANKVDTLNQKERHSALMGWEKALGVKPLPYSATTGEGREELLKEVLQ